ncbi:MAG: MarR family transcriptional regulator [Liquorilactobacillus nagelii]|uniref:MarR family winged helix-turn-helix transcriptional regulator n=1 Tax=Liquorilactobacillus nagelii TaxID=82688 RepID=UPI0039EC2C1A
MNDSLAINECLYFTSNRLARQTEKLAKKAYQPTGISPTYNYILLTVDQSGTITLHELAKKMGIAPSTMSRFIKFLVEKKLLNKQIGWRKIELSLSSQGKQLMPTIKACYRQLDEQVNSLISRQEKEKLVRLLNQQFLKF